MARSLNRVQLIGNLTRDPELRYTPNGTAVCSFGMATNRSWKTDSGEKREEADFHNIVAWDKLAEICSQFLVKGRKVYVEGRLQTRSWTGQDGTQKIRTEIIISDMILLDSRKQEPVPANEMPQAKEPKEEPKENLSAQEPLKSEPARSRRPEGSLEHPPTAEGKKKALPPKEPSANGQVKDPQESKEVVPDDIPF